MAAEISQAPSPAAVENSPYGNHSEASAQRAKPRKFSLFMKRLANLKSSAAGPSSSQNAKASGSRSERSASFSHDSTSKYTSKHSKTPSLSRASSNDHLSFAVSDSGHHGHHGHYHTASTDTLRTDSNGEREEHCDERRTLASRKSGVPPSATTATTTSPWSSPTASVRSLTTTLTTMQSTAPGSMLNANYTYDPHPTHHHNPNDPPVMYSAPFPSHGPAAPPSPALHNSGLLHPATYNVATANGVWTDNASILTLASSSKRMRRRSVDTDASVRALAPSSVFGGSRESLPLSVLSSNYESGIGGRAPAGERASLYGSPSFASRSIAGDNASVNGATGSIMGEISGQNVPTTTGSPMVSPVAGGRHSLQLGTHSRRSSAWGAEGEEPDRRSMDARSASFKCDADTEVDVASVKDGSSNYGVWHGVPGKPEKNIVAKG